ncbi:hypothetical protein [Prevotella sp. OH937_COT-195]|uniref:hypothetical protein n=1 Tax=Prevotella sp. OH937_COT-195 TaxID=2491051 RepID=UPI000F9FCDCA|nr:hypothetical protein [Prevotella sp. OH937_COT-195]RRD03067.1 hypothetical protein EII32_01040 [Prevotella sp. OH937_COT-195]
MMKNNIILICVVVGFSTMSSFYGYQSIRKKEKKADDILKTEVRQRKNKGEEKVSSITFEKAIAMVCDMKKSDAINELLSMGWKKLASKNFKFHHEMAGTEETGKEIVLGKNMIYKNGKLVPKGNNSVGVIIKTMYVTSFEFAFSDKNSRDEIVNGAIKAGFECNENEDEDGKLYIKNIDEVREKILHVYDGDGIYFAEIYMATEL